MRISPIAVRPAVLRTNNLRQRNLNVTNQMTFKSSVYEEEVEREVEKQREYYNWFEWNLGGAEEKERNNAKIKIDKRNHENELKRIEAETINRVNEARMKDLQDYATKLEAQQRRTDELIVQFKNSHNETITIQNKALEAQAEAAKNLKTQLIGYQKLLSDQKELQAKRDKETEELIKKMEEARTKRDSEMEKRFEQELLRMKELYESQIKANLQETEKVQNIKEIFQKMNTVSKNKGFGRIGGYTKEKNILMEMVGSPIALERDGQKADVPNGILFFGPKGNGKTLFAESFAQQLDCNIVKIEDTLDPVENLKNLRAIANKAQENFEKTGIRTIIQIDEFDDYAPKGSRLVGPLKTFMDDASEKYHCTLFATTNYPEKLDDILLRSGRFAVKVGLAPADKQNALAVLKYHGQVFADNTVNFEKLAEEVTINYPTIAYSNAKLANIASAFAKKYNLKTMTHKDFMKAIKNTNPDIKKETMELFKKQMEFIKHT